MPNWISNEVRITGSKEELAKLKYAVKIDNEEFDFNGIIKRPKELDGFSSPVRIISKTEFQIQEKKKGKIKEKIKDKVERGEELTKEESQGQFFGLGGITKEMQQNFIEKYGVDNWYDWTLQNWGVKWNSSSVSVLNNTDEELHVFFLTPWATPAGVFEAMSEKYPNLKISVGYADEDFGHNVGEFTFIGGVVTEVNQPKGGSYEAYKMALEYSGGKDYYLYEIFQDYDNLKDFGSKEFGMNVINLSIDEGYFDEDLPKWVLEIGLPILVEKEKFELAAKVKKELDKKLSE